MQITGSIEASEGTFTCHTAYWPEQEITETFQWYLDGVPIPRATSKSFRPAPGETRNITCQVWAATDPLVATEWSVSMDRMDADLRIQRRHDAYRAFALPVVGLILSFTALIMAMFEMGWL